MCSTIVAEGDSARIELPAAARILSPLPALLSKQGKSMLTVSVDPDPMHWIQEIVQWDANLPNNPNVGLAVERSNALTSPYLGREQVIESTVRTNGVHQYVAKLMLTDPANHRRAIFSANGLGSASNYNEEWASCIASFRFVGERKPIGALLPPPVLPQAVTQEVRSIGERLLASVGYEKPQPVWIEATANGIQKIHSLLMRVAQTEHSPEDVTRYTMVVVNGRCSPAGGIRFFDSLAEALAEAEEAYGVDPSEWSPADAPSWATVVDESIAKAYDAVERSRSEQ